MESGLDDAGPVESGQLSDSVVSLADMLARDVHFEWYEALAIALQLCHGITQSSEQSGPSTVQLDNVFVAPGGDVVALTRPQHPATAVPRVAELLGEMLPDFHRRTTFRAVIAQATSDPPGYASLEQLAQALAPFERPHRDEIVRGVYQRWRVIAATALPAESDALDIFLSEGPGDFLSQGPGDAPIADGPIVAPSEMPSPPPPLPNLTSHRELGLAPTLTASSTANLRPTLTASPTPTMTPSLAPRLASILTPSPTPTPPPTPTPSPTANLVPGSTSNLTSYTPSFTTPIKPRARRPFWRGQSVFLLRASALAAILVMILGLSIWALGLRRPAAVVGSPVVKQTDPIPDRQETQVLPATPERSSAAATRSGEPVAASRRRAAPTLSAETPGPSGQPAPSASREIAIPSPAALSAMSSTAPASRPIASNQPVQPLRAAPSAPRRSPPETTALAASVVSEPVIDTALKPAAVDRPPNSVPSSLVPPALVRPDSFDVVSTTFSDSDAGVVPPVPDSSQQLWLMPASPRRSDQIRIEVVVDERGSVRSVRAVERTDSLADAVALTMSLSAVKSWHFTPALKDGRPVKYRLSLTLTIH